MSWDELGPVLQAIGVAQAAREELSLAELGRALNLSEGTIASRIEVIERYGLAYSGLGEIGEPFLRGSTLAV